MRVRWKAYVGRICAEEGLRLFGLMGDQLGRLKMIKENRSLPCRIAMFRKIIVDAMLVPLLELQLFDAVAR